MHESMNPAADSYSLNIQVNLALFIYFDEAKIFFKEVQYFSASFAQTHQINNGCRAGQACFPDDIAR